MTAFLEELFSNIPIILTLAGCAAMVVMLVVSAVETHRHKDEMPRAPSNAASAPVQAQAHTSSVSALAGLSFLCGLGAVCLVTASAIMAMCVSMSEVTQMPAAAHAAVELAGKITLYASLLPAVGAIAFALAARGSIAGSRLMRGRPLYRTGILLALATGVLVLEAKALNPATWSSTSAFSWVSRRTKGPADLTRGYLGVEFDRDHHADGVRISRVIPNSPAESAGLQAGDCILAIDGVTVIEGQAFADHIAGLKPATRIVLKARRGKELLSMTAVLMEPVSSLLELLADQSSDLERLALLRAAGTDRQYTSAELKDICETFDVDSHRIEAFRLALPNLVDLQNAYEILPAFDTSHYKDEASRQIVGSKHPPK
jgi:hypothetical protein